MARTPTAAEIAEQMRATMVAHNDAQLARLREVVGARDARIIMLEGEVKALREQLHAAEQAVMLSNALRAVLLPVILGEIGTVASELREDITRVDLDVRETIRVLAPIAQKHHTVGVTSRLALPNTEAEPSYFASLSSGNGVPA